jgi:peptidoglycan hydrolase-like protein with peptidoglycan-binding domain
MKKYVIFLLILGLFLVGTTSVKAVSMSDLQNEIKSLSEQIVNLKSQLLGQVISSRTVTVEAPVPTVASTTTVLTKGVKSTEVAQIQTALRNQGFSITADGSFGAKTEEAVKAFQTAKSLPVTGKVDSLTRSKLVINSAIQSKATACNSNSPSTIKILSPNGGEVFTAGQQITVKWESCNVTSNSIGIFLIKHNPAVPYTQSQTSGDYGGFSLGSYSTVDDGIEQITLPNSLNTNLTLGQNYFIVINGLGDATNIGSGYHPQDYSDNLFTINNNTSCSSQVKLIFIPETTSPDFIDGNITNIEQGIARFWIYSPCNVSIEGLHTQPFGPYSVPSGTGGNVGYTFWGANRFSQFSAYKGYGNSVTALPVLGTTTYSGIGASSHITFTQPLQLTAGVPQMITIGGKLKPANQVSGTILDKGQFCIAQPMNLKDSSGNLISLLISNTSGTSVTNQNFLGYFTCGDIFGIN